MPVFELKPWKENMDLELCGATFCFQLRDKEHRIYVFYHEYGDKGSITLDISFQKIEGYKNYVKNIIEFDLPPNAFNENSRLWNIYKSVLEMYEDKKEVNINLKWEDEGIMANVTTTLEKDSVYVMLKLINGPHKLFFSASFDDEHPEDVLRRLMKDAAGFYVLFKEYVKNKPADQELQEKT